jgi:hypothetical protein
MTASMRTAAAELLGRLDEQQRRTAVYRFEDHERFRWQYTPGARGGLWLSGMDAGQRAAAMDLLRSGLDQVAYAKARGVIELEPVLRDIEQKAGRRGWERRDAGHYWFAVFGDPAGPVWAWRVGGHHLCVHVTVVESGTSFVPLFLGANPATAPDGSRVLAEEEDLAGSLVRSLGEDQRAAAVLSTQAPSDIITGNAERAEIAAVPTGIGWVDLDAAQRDLLERLIGVYAGRPAQPLAVDPRAATFAWLGSTEPGEGHYYAVRADTLLIELDNTQNGANHVHSVVRDVARDWGEDLLAAHYRHAHHKEGR